MEEIDKTEPKPRTFFQNLTYSGIGLVLVILGIHGLITKNTLMIFGDQSKPSQYYGFAFAYLILGLACTFSAFLDVKSLIAKKNLQN